jgi:predicted O-methyltransferase YrrM
MKKSVYRYFTWSVPGWLPLVDHILIEIIGKFQRTATIQGPILEIGCYKGKSAILLGKLLGEKEELFLVDLFEKISTENVMDTPLYAGLTQRNLERNLRLYQIDATVLKIDSQDIMETLSTRNFRMIHIDAGHTYGPVSKDLHSAISMIQDDGVIILDDYRNISFPGMWLAFAEFLSNKNASVLFATETKVYLVKTEHLETYKSLLEHIRESPKFRILSSTGDSYYTLEFNLIFRLVQKLYSAAGLVSIRFSNLVDSMKL